MNRNKEIFLLLCLSVGSALLLQSCTSTSGLKDAETDGTWRQIRSSGVSEDADYSVWSDKVDPIGHSADFLPDTKCITWWALFNKTTFAMAFMPSFKAKWIAPDGSVYREVLFNKSAMNDVFMKTKLPVAGTDVADKPGRWAVEIYFKDSRIDRKEFRVVTQEIVDKEKAALVQTMLSQQATVKPAPARPVSGPAVPAPVMSGDDSWFAQKYAAAKTSFAAGNYGDAEKILKEILATEPFRTEAHLALASVYSRQKNPQSALNELDFAIQNPVYRDKAMELRTQIIQSREKEKQP
ncbi:MAG: tetratricopeptide repeat protein [Candidatus Omnitrophica bacterium]|nr:tetratricopeptide repeat protein [Candidatus Omnitrophota bacterium]MDD5671628.1 tetratricopeptide repeat protein [Candidatus Omnitrophota bacterium]